MIRRSRPADRAKRLDRWRADLEAELAAVAPEDRRRRAWLHYELAYLLDNRLSDHTAAIRGYGQALSLDPRLRPNLWEVKQIFYRRGRWEHLGKLLDAEQRFRSKGRARAETFTREGMALGYPSKELR